MSPSGIVLLLGSAPDAVQCRDWPKSRFDAVVAINNAWRVRDDWDYLVHPDDFPQDRRPQAVQPNQILVGSNEYVPANNRFGGIVYNGGTMAFTAGYWALAALKPKVMAFLGCDMVYPSKGNSHFYGRGTADPLRDDISLRNLESKSARLMLQAARVGCACVRLSSGPSRLVFPSVERNRLDQVQGLGRDAGGAWFDKASAMEERLGYSVKSGRYWKQADRFSSSEIDAVDSAWLRAAQMKSDLAQPNRCLAG